MLGLILSLWWWKNKAFFRVRRLSEFRWDFASFCLHIWQFSEEMKREIRRYMKMKHEMKLDLLSPLSLDNAMVDPISNLTLGFLSGAVALQTRKEKKTVIDAFACDKSSLNFLEMLEKLLLNFVIYFCMYRLLTTVKWFLALLLFWDYCN